MSLRIIHFKIDGENFGIDIGEVQEIVSYTKGLVVSGAHPELDSLVKIRGQVIPVLDLRKKFGVPPIKNTKNNRIIILRTEVGLVGLSVDSVKNVITLSDKEMSGVPKLLPKLSVKYVDSIGQVGEDLILLLKTSTLFNSFDMEMVSRHTGMSEEDYDGLEWEANYLAEETEDEPVNPDDVEESVATEKDLVDEETEHIVDIDEVENGEEDVKQAIWPCPMCGKVYKTEAWVTRHIKAEHADFLGE